MSRQPSRVTSLARAPRGHCYAAEGDLVRQTGNETATQGRCHSPPPRSPPDRRPRARDAPGATAPQRPGSPRQDTFLRHSRGAGRAAAAGSSPDKTSPTRCPARAARPAAARAPHALRGPGWCTGARRVRAREARGRRNARVAREQLVEPHGVRAPLRVTRVELRQLRKPERGGDLGHPVVVAELRRSHSARPRLASAAPAAARRFRHRPS